jgi:hypothetical protein
MNRHSGSTPREVHAPRERLWSWTAGRALASAVYLVDDSPLVLQRSLMPGYRPYQPYGPQLWRFCLREGSGTWYTPWLHQVPQGRRCRQSPWWKAVTSRPGTLWDDYAAALAGYEAREVPAVVLLDAAAAMVLPARMHRRAGAGMSRAEGRRLLEDVTAEDRLLERVARMEERGDPAEVIAARLGISAVTAAGCVRQVRERRIGARRAAVVLPEVLLAVPWPGARYPAA